MTVKNAAKMNLHHLYGLCSGTCEAELVLLRQLELVSLSTPYTQLQTTSSASCSLSDPAFLHVNISTKPILAYVLFFFVSPCCMCLTLLWHLQPMCGAIFTVNREAHTGRWVSSHLIQQNEIIQPVVKNHKWVPYWLHVCLFRETGCACYKHSSP